MKSFLALWGWLLLVYFAEAKIVKEDGELEGKDPCANVFCHAGQECMVEEGEASCQCLDGCPEHENPVCGSDGITYPNHCELHRTACVRNKKIAIKNKGSCREIVTTKAPTGKVNMSKPVVCYEHDRDEMRGRLVEWLRLQDVELQGDEGYRRILRLYFDKMDRNRDGKLDLEEMTQLIKQNLTVAQIREADEFINPVLQGLCTDALISITDEDEDLELSFHEFVKCLDPHFKPPKKSCELEGEHYRDGTEIPNDCNSCVCACGHWVCTALECDPSSSNHVQDKFVVEGEAAKKKLEEKIQKEEQEAEEEEQKNRVLLLHRKRGHGHHSRGRK